MKLLNCLTVTTAFMVIIVTGCDSLLKEKVEQHGGAVGPGPGGVTPLPAPSTSTATAVAPEPDVQRGPFGRYVDSTDCCSCQDANGLGGSITAPMPTATVTHIVYQQPAPAPVVYIHYATPTVYLNTIEQPAFYEPETQFVQSGWGASVLNLGCFQFVGRGNQGGGYRGYSKPYHPSYYPPGPQVHSGWGGGGYRGGFGGGHSGGHH